MVTSDNFADAPGETIVEGFAHVVAIEGDWAWLEPEQTTSCGSCASSGACGAKGIGTTASRLEARRFRIDNAPGLVVGERVVVGIPQSALVKASLTAYAIPLVSMLLAGALGQWAVGKDLVTMAAMVGGLFLGLGLARLGAGHLSSRGQIVPRFVRRANLGFGVICKID